MSSIVRPRRKLSRKRRSSSGSGGSAHARVDEAGAKAWRNWASVGPEKPRTRSGPFGDGAASGIAAGGTQPSGAAGAGGGASACAGASPAPPVAGAASSERFCAETRSCRRISARWSPAPSCAARRMRAASTAVSFRESATRDPSAPPQRHRLVRQPLDGDATLDQIAHQRVAPRPDIRARLRAQVRGRRGPDRRRDAT